MGIVIFNINEILNCFEELVGVLLLRVFNFFLMIFEVKLLGKIIYLCNELLFEKNCFKILENI